MSCIQRTEMPSSMPVTRRIVVSLCSDTFHVFHCKIEQLGDFRDIMSAQTLKLSPQPQASLTLGLLNLKPSLSPSRV